MSPAITSPATASSAPIDNTALKPTDAGVKKPAKKQKAKQTGFKKNQKAKLALQRMHVFYKIKAHRSDDEYKDMTFPEQQKVLGKLWKASPENPRNNA
ncbi:hypothetical protein BU25DRAFT_453354 [Macroventuria anomochaeta]|uniref:Uncharacterized protein n=1 Tax=Macroventuria anomochaeta TaxID=301207 RepID=A0ACB6SHG4_9PLEO|nr:uncharacterized protein BU25DRAFT_453354 [Macroventuria anomochaeta]KAF2633611.1 hypothetical protein BU25DRAFT_453354 [Macroventuria anomochaeta]